MSKFYYGLRITARLDAYAGDLNKAPVGACTRDVPNECTGAANIEVERDIKGLRLVSLSSGSLAY